MFALGIRYLNGWAMATHPTDRERAEWPPHPDRVFMALAAAHFETDGGPTERAVLEWLQALPAPAMAVGDHDQREIVTSYVPVNDTEIARPKNDTPSALAKRVSDRAGAKTLDDAKGKGLALLPEFRSRQSRSFPVAIPEALRADGAVGGGCADGMPRMYLTWGGDASGEQREALRTLCAKVTSIGHSASLVQVWVEPAPPPANLVPVDGVATKHQLRVMGASRLANLESRYKAGLRPTASHWQGYDTPEASPIDGALPSSVFDSNLLILRRIDGPRLGLESTLQLTEAVRGTVLTRCAQPHPEWISGHTPDGNPSEKPHLACIPLADVGHEHARGHLLGVAIIVPRDISAQEQKALNPVLFYTPQDEQPDQERYGGMPRQFDLTMGRAGVWRVELADADPRVTLRPEMWTGRTRGDNAGSAAWATVTPIVFDRHPKETWNDADPPRVRAENQAAYWKDVESMIAGACERIGLPRPVEVVARPASHFVGAPSSGHMPRMLRKDGTQKRQTHAVIRFDTPVVGPVLLGAGRYRGYGVCRPLPKEWNGGFVAKGTEGGEA